MKGAAAARPQRPQASAPAEGTDSTVSCQEEQGGGGAGGERRVLASPRRHRPPARPPSPPARTAQINGSRLLVVKLRRTPRCFNVVVRWGRVRTIYHHHHRRSTGSLSCRKYSASTHGPNNSVRHPGPAYSLTPQYCARGLHCARCLRLLRARRDEDSCQWIWTRTQQLRSVASCGGASERGVVTRERNAI